MSAILSTQNLVKKYGYKIVSNNISLTINKGDIYGFVGKNGLRYILKNLLSISLRSGIGIRI